MSSCSFECYLWELFEAWIETEYLKRGFVFTSEWSIANQFILNYLRFFNSIGSMRSSL